MAPGVALGAPGGAARSLGHLLEERSASIGGRDFLRFERHALTFAQVNARAGQVATLLHRRGVAPGDRVAVMLPNGLEFPCCWLGIARAGAVMVPVNVQYRAHDLAFTLGDAGASLALVDPALAPLVRAAAPPGLTPDRVLQVPPAAMRDATVGGVAAELHAAPAAPTADAVGPDTLLNIQYTSGTTGSPKGCMLTHAYWLRLSERSAAYAGLRDGDVALTAQPFSYMDPQWNVGMCLVAGVPLVILPRFSASTFWASVREAGATFCYVLGTMPVLLLKQPPDPAVERAHRVRFVACSGIVPELHAEFERRWGVPWREAFGMTETGIDLAVPLEDVACVGSGAVGRPVEGREARVIDPDGRVLGDGAVGQLCVRGPAMMRGYWNRPDATAERMRDGWMHTGDLAWRDERGYYHLVGRRKDMVRRGGENISAAEVEGVLAQHPAVRAAAVVGIPDELRGEEVKAFVELQPGHESIDPRAILDFAGERLARFKVPRFLEYVHDMPRTPSERIAKHELLSARDDQRRGAFDATTGAWA